VERYDVVIVGARIAGSTLAALLGRRGISVLLLDTARFPSDALSTHLIFGDSFDVWEGAGAWPDIVAIGGQPMPWVEWHRQPPNTPLHVRIFGQGTGDATRSARLLAAQIASGLGGDLDASLAEYHAYRDADLLPKFDLMINGRAAGVGPEDFERIVRDAGLDPTLAFRFVNIFTGGFKVHDVFNAAVVEQWRERAEPRRKDGRAPSGVAS
jgi:2-polyprenyl-6-methoxyphenol hydroxylase-like FAD-dependent oxidoreductase